jgi:hypothetical protein
MQTILAPARRDAARGLPSGPALPPAAQMDADLELTDEELEAVVGGLARVYLPGISAAPAPV